MQRLQPEYDIDFNWLMNTKWRSIVRNMRYGKHNCQKTFSCIVPPSHWQLKKSFIVFEKFLLFTFSVSAKITFAFEASMEWR